MKIRAKFIALLALFFSLALQPQGLVYAIDHNDEEDLDLFSLIMGMLGAVAKKPP